MCVSAIEVVYRSSSAASPLQAKEEREKMCWHDQCFQCSVGLTVAVVTD